MSASHLVPSRPAVHAIAPSLLSLIAASSIASLRAEDAPAVPPPPTPVVVDEALVVTGQADPFAVGAQGSATKLDLEPQQTPQAITSLPRALIESQGSFSLRDALRNAPGVTIAAGEGGRTGDSIAIRGFVANSDLYLDGLKDNGQYFRDTYNLERVEVLRGASALLFGRGATGGAVNSITRKPTDAWTADAAATVGSYGFLRGSAGVGGPLVDDLLGMRLDAFAQDGESFRDEQHLRRMGVAPGVVITPGDTTRVLLQVAHLREDSTMDYGVPMYHGRPADVPIETYYGFEDDSFQEFRATQVTGTVEQRISDQATVRNATRYADYSRYYRTEILGAVTGIGPAATAARTQALRDNDQDNLINQTELTLRGRPFGHDASLVAGVELGRERYGYRSKDSTGVTPVSVFNPQSPPTTGAGRANSLDGPLNARNDAELTSLAGYALGTLDLTPEWKAVLGLRWDRFDADYDSGPTIAAPAPVSFSTSDTEFSPRAGVVWTPRAEISLYASYSTSFNPSAETFSLSAATANLDPEENVNYEVGAKTTLLDERVSAGIAVFRLEKTNARTADPTNTALQVLDGKQRTDGIEVDVTGEITKRWRTYAGLALFDAEVVESNTVTGGIPVEGKRPINAPRASGSLWMTYDIGLGFTVGAGVFATSSRYTNAVNTVSLPGYARTDISLAYRIAAGDVDWSAQVNVFNVTDITYYDAGSGNYAYPGARLSGQLTLAATY